MTYLSRQRVGGEYTVLDTPHGIVFGSVWRIAPRDWAARCIHHGDLGGGSRTRPAAAARLAQHVRTHGR